MRTSPAEHATAPIADVADKHRRRVPLALRRATCESPSTEAKSQWPPRRASGHPLRRHPFVPSRSRDSVKITVRFARRCRIQLDEWSEPGANRTVRDLCGIPQDLMNSSTRTRDGNCANGALQPRAAAFGAWARDPRRTGAAGGGLTHRARRLPHAAWGCAAVVPEGGVGRGNRPGATKRRCRRRGSLRRRGTVSRLPLSRHPPLVLGAPHRLAPRGAERGQQDAANLIVQDVRAALSPRFVMSCRSPFLQEVLAHHYFMRRCWHALSQQHFAHIS